MAYVGLELAMSIVKIGSIEAYWMEARFKGHGDFRDTMSRNDFQAIRASIQFHPPIPHGHSIPTGDPLWHCRGLLEHFQQNCANVAVPMGASALDEASCRCKGRCRAKSYMPNKPIKFGIRFYACVGMRFMYLHHRQFNTEEFNVQLDSAISRSGRKKAKTETVYIFILCIFVFLVPCFFTYKYGVKSSVTKSLFLRS